MNTKARKLHLKSELNQVKRNNLSINDYALKIKSIIEALGYIKVSVEDDDVVRACLDGVGDEYVHFRSSMNTRDDIPEFTDLISMLILEENVRAVALVHYAPTYVTGGAPTSAWRLAPSSYARDDLWDAHTA